MQNEERRQRADRGPGWTQEMVTRKGLGTLNEVADGRYRVLVYGRAAGPVPFELTHPEYQTWLMARWARDQQDVAEEDLEWALELAGSSDW